jgi:hypothetical protein
MSFVLIIVNSTNFLGTTLIDLIDNWFNEHKTLIIHNSVGININIHSLHNWSVANIG